MSLDKDTKYDRQLRLWAHDGQTRLEKSHVCLINATTTGAETLKNLVLPGIGAFTIVDEGTVLEDHLSGNFFLVELDLGSSVAQAMASNLMELNSDVQGYGITDSFKSLLVRDAFWDSFSVVVISEYIQTSELLALKQILWAKNIPLVLVNTAGFYGSLQIICTETTIVETHDPSKLFDLRIDCPWPELQAYADSFELAKLDDTDHAHVPYIVLFIKALQLWKLDHEGLLPQNYTEKREFRSGYVEKLSRNIALETNFIEASQSVHRALQVTSIPKSLQELFEKSKITNDQLNLPVFWLYIRALKNFVELNDSMLPLPGNLPDMASNTTNYIGLQNIYREKAVQDQEGYAAELLKVFRSVGRLEEEISKESVLSFCKNAAFLFVSWGSPFSFSETLRDEMLSTDGAVYDEKKHNTLAIHFGMLALHGWIEMGRPEGFELFLKCFHSVTAMRVDTELPESVRNTLHEVFLHHTSSYHNLSSFMGGAAGQEVLKIATAQYIPLDNLYVYDGIRSVSAKWKI